MQGGGDGFINPGPGDEEDRAHRHAHGASVQRVACRGGEQYRIDAQSGRRAEDGTDVGRVGHAVDDHHAAGVTAHVAGGAGQGAPHGTQHAARQRVACEGRQQGALACVHGNVTAAVDDAGGVARDVPPLAQQRQGLVARIQGHVDYLGALGDEDALVRLQAVAQLGLGQGAIDFHAGVVQ